MLTSCSLAYAELFLAVAAIFSRFDLEMYDTTEERDIRVVRDYNFGMADASSPGVQARIAKELKD